jgi:hypothetical protein
MYDSVDAEFSLSLSAILSPLTTVGFHTSEIVVPYLEQAWHLYNVMVL